MANVLGSSSGQQLVSDVVQVVQSHIPDKVRLALYPVLGALGIGGGAVASAHVLTGWPDLIVSVLSGACVAFSAGMAMSHVPAKAAAATSGPELVTGTAGVTVTGTAPVTGIGGDNAPTA